MMVLAAVLTGGPSSGRESLIKDILNGVESAVEIKAPSVPSLPYAGVASLMYDKDTSPCRLVGCINSKLYTNSLHIPSLFIYLFLPFGDFSTEKMKHL